MGVREAIKRKFSKVNEESLPPGYYTLGDGKVRKIPTEGFSKWYKRGDYSFRYNYATKNLECYYIDKSEKIDELGLSFTNWIDNPDYWVDNYLNQIEDEAKSLGYYEESKKLKESIKKVFSKRVDEAEAFVIAYREGGQDKFSSVTANSSSEALQIFNAAVDKAGRNVNNVHIAVEDVDITESLPPIRDYKVVRMIDDEPTKLATVRARNKEEAKANMLLALLDAGYYEDEVTPEIEDGTITVQLDECDDLKEEDECKTAYVVSECIYNEDGSTETKPLFSIKADSPEEAQSRLVKCAREHGISDLSNLVLHEYDAEVARTLLNKIYEDDKDTKKAFRIRYKYNYVEETDESPYVRSAVFEAPLIVVAKDSEEALNKAMSMSNEIANKNRYMDGEPYNFEIEAVYDSLEDYKSKYRMSNIPVVECDDLKESVDYDTYKYYITIRPETPNPTKMDDLKVKLKQEDILPVYVSAHYSSDGKKYRDSYGWIYLLKSKEDYDKLLDISTEVLGSKDGINVKPLEFNKSEWDIRELNEALEDDPEVADQEYSSADTSINSSKVPAVFKMVKFDQGSINLDYGGGKFDNAAQYLEDTYGAINLVYDPYNRSSEHNNDVLMVIRQNGGADTVTCSNVLNVIKEPAARLAVVRNCKNYLKSGGKAYFTVYEGSGDGVEGPTKAGYQLNKKTADYVDEISQVFSNVTRRGKLIIAEGISVNQRVIEGNIFETPDGVDAHLQGNRHDEGLTLDDLNKAQYSSSMMNDRAEVHVDGRSYVKVSEDQWEYHPTQEKALGYKVTTDRLWNEIIQNAERVDFYP